jgi:glutamyl-tRNA synthetase
LIYEALGAEKPMFAHLPLILAPNKGKLSKRKHGEVVSMTTYRDAGFLPAAFRNFLVLLGWAPYSNQKEVEILDEILFKDAKENPFVGDEIMSLDDLAIDFSLERIHRNNAVFNFDANDPRHWTDDKAMWMNAHYIRKMPITDLLPFVKAELKSAKLWRDEYEDDNREWFKATVDLIRQRFFTLKDFSQQGRAFFSEDFDFDQDAIAKNLKKHRDLQAWLPELADILEKTFLVQTNSPFNLEDFGDLDPSTKGSKDNTTTMNYSWQNYDRMNLESSSNETKHLPFTQSNIEMVVKSFAEEKGTKLGVIMNGARTMLTGLAVGPSMLAVFETLGKEKTVRRLKSQVVWNQ